MGEVEFITSGVSEGKGTRWNYPLMAEIVERKVRETISKNLTEAKKVAASTSKSTRVRLHLKKDLIKEIAESGKSGKQPSYDVQLFRVKDAVRRHLGLKARRDGEEIVLTLTPTDVQKYLRKIEENEEE